MAEHLSDEEQLEALKRWWKENGLQLVLVVVIGLGGWYGWQFWQDKQAKRAADASLIYAAMMDEAAKWDTNPSDDSAQLISTHAETLKSIDADSQYAFYGAMMLAKLAMAAGEYETAAAELNWVLEKNEDQALDSLARLRLARVELARGNDQQALELLQGENTAFTALYQELKGDILARQGNAEQARAAYQSAIDSLEAGDARTRTILELKLNELLPETVQPTVTVEEGA